MRMRNLGLAAAIAIATVASLLPARADSHEGTLSSASDIATWTGGTVGGFGYNPPAHTPDTCPIAAQAQACDSFTLHVGVPSSVYEKPNDGVFITIRWDPNPLGDPGPVDRRADGDFNQWNMFVYDATGSLAASGYALDSNAQAVVIPHAAGDYTVVAVPFYAEASMEYTGQARVVLDRAARLPGSQELLPRMWTTPPHDLHVACNAFDPTTTETNGCTDVPPTPSVPAGWRFGGSFGNSCFADETATAIAAGQPVEFRRCLRFSNDIRNAGDGPLVLRANVADNAGGPVTIAGDDVSATGGECHMQQIVRTARGGESTHDAGKCSFHAAHAHYHYLSFAKYELRRVTGAAPDFDAALVSQGRKLGYCLIDVDFWGRIDHADELSARQYSFPTCNLPDPAQSAANAAPVQEMGINAGWGDIYTWDLPDQYLDITGVAAGDYDVISTANPDCTLRETAPGLETSVTRIHLEDDAVTVLGTFGPFSNGC